MTAESLPSSERSLIRDRLPWVIGVAALAVYLLTLSRWVTLSNLTLVVKANGWDWQPALSQPLLYLVMLPFRLVPDGSVPLLLNVLNAGCAALTLMTLARSVALLPHNRVEAQRHLVKDQASLLTQRDAWVPMVFAAVALGLQLSFWENSIAATGEMLDLLLFAYIIRCLLEHRVREQQSWLDRAAVVFGIAMANNWGMAVFLPIFVVAVLRTKRLGFFSLRTVQRIERDGWERVKPAFRADLRFFLRMLLLGLAGTSLFLVLPLVQALTPDSALTAWQSLKTAATSYETTFHLIGRAFWRVHRAMALLLMATSLLPIFLLSIRWGSLGAREGSGQIDLGAYILHAAHAFLLLLCFWVMFDPPFSPRQIGRQNGFPLAFLPLYYLTALSIGYYSGFFLLLFGPEALHRISRRYINRRILCRIVPALVYLLALLSVVGLFMVNIRPIRAANEPHLDRFARLAVGGLPSDGALLLSDDTARLVLVQAELAREGKAGRFVPVDARSLPLKAYRSWLSRKYPGRWPDPASESVSALAAVAPPQSEAPLEPLDVVRLIARVAEQSKVYWVQPSVGPLLDEYYLVPHGLVSEMKSYPPTQIMLPPLSAEELAENQAFWKGAIEGAIDPLLQLISQTELPRPPFERALMARGRLRTPPPPQLRALAWWYSGALNRWGVTLQRNGRWSEATPCFMLARDLKSDNPSASVNLQCNTNFLAHQKLTVARNAAFEEQFSKYKNLNQLLTENGPLDDPSYCFQLGLGYFRERMPRQALQELERAKELVPEDVGVRLTLGDVYNSAGQSGQALRIVYETQNHPALRPLGETNEIELAFLEARSWYTATNRPRADGIIYALLAFHPNDTALRERAVATFTAYQSFPEAHRLIDRELQRSPDDLTALTQKGNLYLLSGDFSNAIPVLTHVLSLTNLYAARLNRSFAYMRAGQLDAAEADCRELLQAFPDSYRTYRGLGDIAQQRKDTNAAIRYYEQYIAKAEGDNEEVRAVNARLKALQRSLQ